MKTIMYVSILISLFVTSTNSQAATAARKWQKLIVPGGICGDGSEYPIFVDIKDPSKIAFHLQGGNACWSKSTCYGFLDFTRMDAITKVSETDGFVSLDPAQSPLTDYSMVYVPYCTGDVHLGDHVANYEGKVANHKGKQNIIAVMEFLENYEKLPLGQAKDVVFSGGSAGAIGAVYHVITVDKYIKNATHKVLIADSPGLHFGPDFWMKFTPALIQDYGNALHEIGLNFDPHEGNVSYVSRLLCDKYPDWQFGFLQAAHDKTMSERFGGETRNEKYYIVYFN
jgi:hypothetical protein